MVEQSKQQGSGVPYMYIVLVVAINYHHLLLANRQVHAVGNLQVHAALRC